MIRQMRLSLLFFLALFCLFLLLDIRLFHEIQSLTFVQNKSHSLSITAKSVMMDHVNYYVMSPLSQHLEDWTHMTSLTPWLTANQISYFGVFVAIIAAKVVVSDSLVVRRLAILIFLLRQFLDDLDGLVARVRMGLDKRLEVSVTGTSGYVVDGICDAIGFAVFLIAVFLQTIRLKRVQNDNKYKLLFTDSETTIGDKQSSAAVLTSADLRSSVTTESANSVRVLFRNHALFGLQMLLSCVLWNRYIDAFHTSLETELNAIKLQIFKSRLQWIIMWLWRCYGNAHQLMTFFLVSIWLNRSQKLINAIHFWGFVALIGLSFLTEVHLNDIQNYLKTNKDI